MGKKIFITFLTLLGTFSLIAQEKPDFKAFDESTYSLYQDKDWTGLVKEGKAALDAGIDYYYLRMRLGIAFFERGSYIQAARHFKEALTFSPVDKTALEYLYFCYVNVNKTALAMDVYLDSPPSLREKLKSEGLPLRSFVFAESGLQFFDQAESTIGWDAVGGQTPYIESPVINGGFFFSAGGRFPLGMRSSGTVAYSYLSQDKTSRYRLRGEPALSDDYILRQNHFYGNMSIYVGKGIRIVPAFHYIDVRFNTLLPTFDNLVVTLSYSDVRLRNEVAFLAMEKDFEIATACIFGAYSTLNDKEQYQAGFRFTILPAGNLNVYLSSTLLIHQNDGNMRGVFDQLVGFRLFKPLWMEISATTGPLENYHEDQAYVVYNLPDRIRFKSDAGLILAINKHLNLSVKYYYLARSGSIYYLKVPQGMPLTEMEMLSQQVNYSNHNIIGGLLWKL